MTQFQGAVLQITVVLLGLLLSYKVDKIVSELEHLNATLVRIEAHTR